MKVYCLMFAIVFVTLSWACASSQTQPVSAQPSATQPAVDPAVDAWLIRIEQSAHQIKTLHAKLRYDRVQGLLGDRQRRWGKLVFDAGPPQRFAVNIYRLVVDGRNQEQDEAWIFDGWWLAQRNGDDKVFNRWELVGHDQEAQNLLEMEHGPFVLPLDMNRQRLLERFDVSIIAADEADPENTIHLRLLPKQGVRVEHTQIDLWYDRETLIPRQSATLDDAENESVFLLMDVVVGEPVKDKLFSTSVPPGNGWIIEEHALEVQEQSPPDATTSP